MTSFLGDDCHTPWLFLKMKFLRTHFHLRLTWYTHIDNATTVLPILHVGPDNPAQTFEIRDERHHKMAQELMRVGRGEHNPSNVTAIISVFLWKPLHNLMDKTKAAYYPPRWPALQKFKEPQKDCRRTLAEWQRTSRIAGISLLMHCKGYLKASSQKYCKQQTTGRGLRSRALHGPAGKSCPRLCGVQMCSGWYSSPIKRWAADIQNRLKVD